MSGGESRNHLNNTLISFKKRVNSVIVIESGPRSGGARSSYHGQRSIIGFVKTNELFRVAVFQAENGQA